MLVIQTRMGAYFELSINVINEASSSDVSCIGPYADSKNIFRFYLRKNFMAGVGEFTDISFNM